MADPAQHKTKEKQPLVKLADQWRHGDVICLCVSASCSTAGTCTPFRTASTSLHSFPASQPTACPGRLDHRPDHIVQVELGLFPPDIGKRAMPHRQTACEIVSYIMHEPPVRGSNPSKGSRVLGARWVYLVNYLLSSPPPMPPPIPHHHTTKRRSKCCKPSIVTSSGAPETSSWCSAHFALRASTTLKMVRSKSLRSVKFHSDTLTVSIHCVCLLRIGWAPFPCSRRRPTRCGSGFRLRSRSAAARRTSLSSCSAETLRPRRWRTLRASGAARWPCA